MPLGIEDFLILKPITQGAYGKVYLAQKKNEKSKYYAIKMMSKDDMKDKNLADQVTAERNALAISHCPYIVHLFYSLQSKQNVYLVMEYMGGGDLKTLIIMYGQLPQDHASIYCKEIMIAVQYLHNHSIIHRDLKPDNILIGNDGHLKLTDFGLSKVKMCNKQLQLNEILYTPSRKISDTKVDFLRTPNQLFSLMQNIDFNKGEHLKTPLNRCKRVPITDFQAKKCGRRPKIDVLQESFEYYSSDKENAPSRRLMSEKKPSNQKLQHAESSLERVLIRDSLSALQDDSHLADLVSVSSVANQINTIEILDLKFSSPTKMSTPYSDRRISRKRCNNSFDYTDLSDNVGFDSQLDLTNDGRVLGTPDYLPPEVLLNVQDRFQGPPIDWWALGVIVFEMVVGTTPFTADFVEDVFKNITTRDVQWPEECLDQSAIEAIEGLLTVSVSQRWGYSELSTCAFIVDTVIPDTMPFIPVFENEHDTGYHDVRNQIFDLQMNTESSSSSDEAHQ